MAAGEVDRRGLATGGGMAAGGASGGAEAGGGAGGAGGGAEEVGAKGAIWRTMVARRKRNAAHTCAFSLQWSAALATARLASWLRRSAQARWELVANMAWSCEEKEATWASRWASWSAVLAWRNASVAVAMEAAKVAAEEADSEMAGRKADWMAVLAERMAR